MHVYMSVSTYSTVSGCMVYISYEWNRTVLYGIRTFSWTFLPKISPDYHYLKGQTYRDHSKLRLGSGLELLIGLESFLLR